MSFKDCKTDYERCSYKDKRRLQIECEQWLKDNRPDYYKVLKTESYSVIIKFLFSSIDIPITEKRFVHFIDYEYLFDSTRGYRFENITPDYERIINRGLDSLKYPISEVDNQFCQDYNETVSAMEYLAQRIAVVYTDRAEIAERFLNMIDNPSTGFEDALQRILFIDQLFWQMGHRLMGLGHLDFILWEVYKKDIATGVMTKLEAKEIIFDFYEALHRYCWLKSNLLLGDTGQIIILGKSDEWGQYDCNELTTLFIEVMREHPMEDPKLLLRVSYNMPRALLVDAVRCMGTGVGGPILANDDAIIDRLRNFGVDSLDALDYGVAACWEPLIPGKSISPNNMKVISYPLVMRKALYRNEAERCCSLEEWFGLFWEELKEEIAKQVEAIYDFRFQYDPLLSIFIGSCYERKKDASCGGADYFNCGFTAAGFSNLINAILNLDELVYRNKELSIIEVKKILDNNYEGYDELLIRLKNGSLRYGMDNEKVIDLCNRISNKTSEILDTYHNYLGGRFKIGVSSQAYVDASIDEPASLDGRKKGEPFGVHISSECKNGYTELLSFASQLDYDDNRFNGNVVDIMVAPSFLENNFDKMVDMIFASIKMGIFEFQMNVVCSEILIDAKSNPDKYPNLIVRVWGFSALFTELPESYQDVLIKRALENEKYRVA